MVRYKPNPRVDRCKPKPSQVQGGGDLGEPEGVVSKAFDDEREPGAEHKLCVRVLLERDLVCPTALVVPLRLWRILGSVKPPASAGDENAGLLVVELPEVLPGLVGAGRSADRSPTCMHPHACTQLSVHAGVIEGRTQVNG